MKGYPSTDTRHTGVSYVQRADGYGPASSSKKRHAAGMTSMDGGESRIRGQPVVEIFPTSDQEYFTKIVDARWVFSSGASDAEVATLYQNGHEQVVKRLNDREGRVPLDAR
jgi:hypothetical protein